MTTPTTPAGRAKFTQMSFVTRRFTRSEIAAIEADARADLLDRLAEGVREMDECCADPHVNRAAVLSLIEEARK